MAKLKVKAPKQKLKKRQFKTQSAPEIVDMMSMGHEPYLPHENPEDLQFRKLIQSSILQVTQEMMSERKDEILARAVELAKEKMKEPRA